MKENPVQTQDSIIIAAAKLINAKLRHIDETNEVYPTPEEVSSTAHKKSGFWEFRSYCLVTSLLQT